MGKSCTDRGSGRRWSAAAALAALTFLAHPLAGEDDEARRFAMFDGVSLVEDPAQPTPQSGFSLGLEEVRQEKVRQEKVRQEEPKHAPEPVRPPGRRRFFTAASELALLELIPWAFDRYIGKYDYAYISTETVRRNFRRGFGYDPDSFVVNQSSHPYHGSLFFNAARENGYSFWESSVFTLMGSLIWECCMENSRPSTNDLVNTTMGGMTRGEVAHRISAMILDNTVSGTNRAIREIAAGIINPAALLNRLLRGDSFRDFENPPDRFPSLVVVSADLGFRHFTSGAHPDQGILSVSFLYGDPFSGDISRPFDSFYVGLDASSPGGVLFTRIEERGILKGWELGDNTASVRSIFGFAQEYEYLNNASQVFGAQILSAGLLSKYDIRPGVFALTDASVMALPLAGIKTTDFEHAQTTRYDYAPGAGARVAGRAYVGGREILGLGYGVVWAHTVNGVSKNNVLQFFRAVGRIPLFGPIGVGGGYTWYSRKTTYPGFVEPRRTQAEWRAFVNAAVVFR